MVEKLNWRPLRGFKIRLTSAIRCLTYKHFVLICWSKEEDGDLNFRISNKGVGLTEAIHRLKIDAIEILQDICDQDSALDEISKIIGK